MSKQTPPTPKKVVVQEKVQTASFQVVEIEEDAIIILHEGWRMRAYFEKDSKQKELITVGREVELEFTGRYDKPTTVKFNKIK